MWSLSKVIEEALTARSSGAHPFDYAASGPFEDAEYEERVLEELAFAALEGEGDPGTATKGEKLEALSEATIDDAFDAWREKARKFDGAMKFCRQKQGLPIGGNGWPLTLSLVATCAAGAASEADGVYIVKWSYIPSMTGQVVRLDEQNRAIWPVVMSFPVRSFKGASVIVTDTGFTIKRIREEREVVPWEIRHLKASWEMALCQASRIPLAPECRLCKAGDSDDAAVMMCAVCHEQWHPKCCEILVAKCIERMPDLAEAVGPFRPETMCGLCNAWLQADIAAAMTGARGP